MSQEVSTSQPNRLDKAASRKREFSWRVAANVFISFKYAWNGVSYVLLTQRNFQIHLLIGAVAIALGIILHLQPVELAVIGLTSGLVLAFEVMNTAIESVVDLTVKQSYHELAKIAKDCAAGAVLISAFAAIVVAGILLVPPIITMIRAALS